MKADIYINDISEISKPFINSDGKQDLKIDLHKAKDLIKYVAYLYCNGHTANFSINNVDYETFDKVRSLIHSAALAKSKRIRSELDI